MKIILSAIFCVIVTSAFAANTTTFKIKRPFKGPIPCSLAGTGYICKANFQASCAKGGGFPIPHPGDGEDYTLSFPAPSGFKFVPNAGRCVETEVKGTGFIDYKGNTDSSVTVRWGCQASVTSDAFVYGYCEIPGVKTPVGKKN